jgi:hypothetical protein|tara:strand:- start:63 stop:653 length:591 start_codon:yes stop_codon:yes gene_type:complete
MSSSSHIINELDAFVEAITQTCGHVLRQSRFNEDDVAAERAAVAMQVRSRFERGAAESAVRAAHAALAAGGMVTSLSALREKDVHAEVEKRLAMAIEVAVRDAVARRHAADDQQRIARESATAAAASVTERIDTLIAALPVSRTEAEQRRELAELERRNGAAIARLQSASLEVSELRRSLRHEVAAAADAALAATR